MLTSYKPLLTNTLKYYSYPKQCPVIKMTMYAQYTYSGPSSVFLASFQISDYVILVLRTQDCVQSEVSVQATQTFTNNQLI